MKNINDLKQRKTDLIAEARKFDDECTKDNRVMSGEEQEKYQKMVDDIRALETEIKRAEELQSLEMSDAPDNTAGFRAADDDDGDNKEKRVFASLGDQLRAVARAHTPGGTVDPRLTRAVSDISGMSEMVDSEGGFLVERDHVPGMLQGVYDNSQLAALCLKVSPPVF